MGAFSLTHWLIVLAIILILFGAGKLPRMMGDFAKGLKLFRKEMNEHDQVEAVPPIAEPAPPQLLAKIEHRSGAG
jgi:sec-independent protein translocase protein TatA